MAVSTLYLILCISSTILLLSSSNAQAESQTLHYCEENAKYAVKVSRVEILPDPVVKGEPFTFKIAAYTSEPILSGDLIYEISFPGIGEPAVFHHDLSEEITIPVPPGKFVLVHTELLPPFTPPGTYNVKLNFVNQNEKQLTCIVFPFTIGGAKSSVSDI